MTKSLKIFDEHQIDIVNSSLQLAEELVDNFYKMSTNQWLRGRYDISTLSQLEPDEIVHGPYAQIVRYVGKYQDSPLSSKKYDFYKICLQDHTILDTMTKNPQLQLFPFCLYILVHELIHVVRFCKFLQNFEASQEEKLAEETMVHRQTRRILTQLNITGLPEVFEFYSKWCLPLEKF
jgi:hypothetical protein